MFTWSNVTIDVYKNPTDTKDMADVARSDDVSQLEQ